MDKTVTVCTHCAIGGASATSNTSIVLTHLWRQHPGVSTDSTKKRVSRRKEQVLLTAAFKQPRSETSDRAVAKALGCFIAIALQPYAAVDDVGFQHMVKILESQYNTPSRISVP